MAVSVHLSPACATCSLQQLVLEQAALIDSLYKRIAELEKCNAELEARLARYENAHIPPSLKEKNKVKSKSGSAGRPKGHKGSTRPTAEPDRVISVTMEECPKCHSVLGNPVKIESRIIEEIPVPKPITVTEFRLAHYDCPSGRDPRARARTGKSTRRRERWHLRADCGRAVGDGGIYYSGAGEHLLKGL